MNLASYLHFFEPVQDHFTRLYSTTSEIITVILVIWVINFLAGMIQKTYSTGKAFGRFYKHYIHKYVISLSSNGLPFFGKKGGFGPRQLN